jgi:hypothetical protein
LSGFGQHFVTSWSKYQGFFDQLRTEIVQAWTEIVQAIPRKPAQNMEIQKIPFLYIKKGCGVIHAPPCPALRQVKQAGQGGGWITPLNKKLFSVPETIEATPTKPQKQKR